MTILQALVLGVVQGLTEFLPVSSTAHLVITQNLFGLHESPVLLVFDIVVHLGTLLSLFAYFGMEYVRWRKGTAEEIGRVHAYFSPRMIWFVVVATIPTGVIGLLLKKWMEASFNSLWLTVVTLVINSFILLSTYWAKILEKKEFKKWLDAFWIGAAQGVSILPGISRSGATVTTALWLRIKPEEAAHFSFLIAIPAVLGAAVFVLPGALPYVSADLWELMLAGFLAAFVAGYFAIAIVFRVVLKGKFHYFAYYTFLLAIVTSIFVMMR